MPDLRLAGFGTFVAHQATMTRNLLLDSRPEADLRKIQEKLKPVVLTARQVLPTQGEFVAGLSRLHATVSN